jgi:hypothetical protein
VIYPQQRKKQGPPRLFCIDPEFEDLSRHAVTCETCQLLLTIIQARRIEEDSRLAATCE